MGDDSCRKGSLINNLFIKTKCIYICKLDALCVARSCYTGGDGAIKGL